MPEGSHSVLCLACLLRAVGHGRLVGVRLREVTGSRAGQGIGWGVGSRQVSTTSLGSVGGRERDGLVRALGTSEADSPRA